MQKKRYEILLPVRNNDGRPVSGELLELTREELVARFDGATFVPGTVLGVWVHEGMRYEDESRRIIVDADDTEETRLFFAAYKGTLLEHFEQIAIYTARGPD